MDEQVTIIVDGERVVAPAGTTVASALLTIRQLPLRVSVTGGTRGALCAMGICFECRVAIDGIPGRRACLEEVREGMRVATCG